MMKQKNEEWESAKLIKVYLIGRIVLFALMGLAVAYLAYEYRQRLVTFLPGAQSDTKSDEGVKAIRNLLRDPDKDIRDMTAGIIQQVYRNYPGRPLREDDFGEEFRESLENRKKTILEWLKGRNK